MTSKGENLEQIKKAIELPKEHKMVLSILKKVALNQTPFECIKESLRFTYDEEDLITNALYEYLNNHIYKNYAIEKELENDK